MRVLLDCTVLGLGMTGPYFKEEAWEVFWTKDGSLMCQDGVFWPQTHLEYHEVFSSSSFSLSFLPILTFWDRSKFNYRRELDFLVVFLGLFKLLALDCKSLVLSIFLSGLSFVDVLLPLALLSSFCVCYEGKLKSFPKLRQDLWKLIFVLLCLCVKVTVPNELGQFLDFRFLITVMVSFVNLTKHLE